jgi:hypothetical protein
MYRQFLLGRLLTSRFVHMWLSKLLLLIFPALLAAQVPVGVPYSYIGTPVDYFSLAGTTAYHKPTGDTYFFSGCLANSTLTDPKYSWPDSTGLPCIGTPNDGSTTTCSGYVCLAQLSKLPSWTVTPSTSNTLITSYANSPNLINSSNGWGTELTSGSGTLGTWKGGNAFARGGRIYLPIYRQDSPGSVWGDSTIFMTADGGANWTDAGRYSKYTITAASCSGTTATLTVANALAGTEKIYVHDVTPAGYNGQFTLTAATGTTVSYTVPTCSGVGAGTVFGAFGVLFSTNWTPSGPANGDYSTSMMFYGSPNQMAWMIPVNFGQDGSFPTPLDAACDPATYVCGLAVRRSTIASNANNETTVMWQVRNDQILDATKWKWYTCSGYNALWPDAATTCDGNQSANMTSTLGSATNIRNNADGGGTWPGNCFSIAYLASHKSYVMSCNTFLGSGRSLGRVAYLWAPHVWGPWYPMFTTYDAEDSTYHYHDWLSIMTLGMVSDSSIPKSQAHISGMTGQGVHDSGGTPAFDAVEFGPGRVQPVGYARRAFGQNYSQLGAGHRLSTSSARGAIPLRGKAADGSAWTLDWWTDAFDHGGFTGGNINTRAGFRDLVTNGTRYFQAVDGSGTPTVGFTARVKTDATGVFISNGYAVSTSRLQGTWTDTVMAGNSSYTMMAVFNSIGNGWADSFTENSAPIVFAGGTTVNSAAVMSLSSYHLSVISGTGYMGDLCWRTGGSEGYGTPTNQLGYCTVSTASGASASTNTVVVNKWYFGAITVKASGSGNPVVTITLCSAGSCTEYGGGACDLHASASGSNCNGLWKWCHGSGCSATPNVTGTKVELGYNPQTQNGPDTLTGYLGEAGVYAGTVPYADIVKIYRTLRDDWLRTGRGLL